MSNDFKSVRNSLAITMLTKAGTRLAQEYKNRRIWTVSLSAEDELYYDVHEWLMEQEDIESPRRALAIKSRYFYDAASVRHSRIAVVFDGESANKLLVGGHEITVSIHDSDNPTINDSDVAKMIKPPKLFFRAKTRAGRDAVIKLMENLHAKKYEKERKPALHVLGKWDDWTRRSDLPVRTMDSVVVKGNVVDELLEDLKEFREQEAEYVRRGIPYHRCYLLSGPPGTGKTSSVKAVAGALGLDLWYVQLSEIGKDAKLVNTLSNVGAGMLLLEDIDSFAAATTRNTDGAKEVTASGLLNALDGVATPHGLITIMTTNFKENLDAALIRPGRVDRIFDFENPDSDTIHRHFEFFYSRPASHGGEWPEGLSSSAVSEIFKRNMHDAGAAEVELLKGA